MDILEHPLLQTRVHMQSPHHLSHPAQLIKHGFAILVPRPLTFKPSLCAHTPITLPRSCGPTFNAPNYLGPHSSCCCITSGLAGSIFSSDIPLALSPSLVVDWITTLLLKEPDGRLPGLPSSNHNRSNHCADSLASRGKDQRPLMFWWWVTRKLWSRGHWEWFDSNGDRPRCTFMPCHRVCGGYACWVWGHFYRTRSVANPQRQLLMLGPLQCSSTPEITSLHEEENFEASYENKFRSIFLFYSFFAPLLLYPFNSYTLGNIFSNASN